MNLKSVRFFPNWDENNPHQVTGLLHLINYVLSLKPSINRWLEIGSHLGESSTLLFGFPQIKTIHLVEQSKYSCDLLSERFKHEILQNRCLIHNGLSQKILSSFENFIFDCVYIDGNHSYDSVIEDIMISNSKTINDGFLCGHDYNKSWPGVIDAVNFFISNSNYSQKDLVLFEDSSWLLRKN